MKLSPADILHLVENTSTKTERMDFLYAKEACFGDVPATMNYALSTVSVERARHFWGFDGPDMISIIPKLQFPSLGPTPLPLDEDLTDDNLMFGLVDIAGREAFASMERSIENDGVDTGEWDKFCGQVPGMQAEGIGGEDGDA